MNYSYIISYTIDTIRNDKYVTDNIDELLAYSSNTKLSMAIDVASARLDCFINTIEVFADDFVYDIDISIIEHID